jgi:O-antigen/teichoic acid export membrane protein
VTSKSTLVKHSALTLAQQIGSALLSLGTIVLVARTLGPEGQGVYTLALLVSTTLSIGLDLGMGPATVYFVSRGDHSPRRALHNTVSLASLISALAIALVIGVGFIWRHQFFQGMPTTVIAITAALAPVQIFHGLLLTVLQGMSAFRAYNVMAALPRFIVLTTLCFLLAINNLTLATSLYAHVFGLGITCAVLLITLHRMCPKTREPRAFAAYSRAILSYGLRAYPNNMLLFLTYRADVFMLGAMASTSTVGIYAIALGIAERLWMLSQSIGVVLLPRVARDHKHGTQANNVTPTITRYSMAAVSLCALAVAVLAPTCIPFFLGERYALATPMLWILLPGIVVLSHARILGHDIAGRGRPHVNSLVSGATLVVNVALNALLIPYLAGSGAALASTLAYTCSAMVTTLYYTRLVQVPWSRTVLLDGADVRAAIAELKWRRS